MPLTHKGKFPMTPLKAFHERTLLYKFMDLIARRGENLTRRFFVANREVEVHHLTPMKSQIILILFFPDGVSQMLFLKGVNLGK